MARARERQRTPVEGSGVPRRYALGRTSESAEDQARRMASGGGQAGTRGFQDLRHVAPEVPSHLSTMRSLAPSDQGDRTTDTDRGSPPFRAEPWRSPPSIVATSLPSDPHEQQADKVADRIVSSPQPRSASAFGPRPASRRVDGLFPGGQPVTDSDRAFFEPRLGVDLCALRIHADERAASAARVAQSNAFTLGPDIVFGKSQYAPGTSTGRRLLAHELVHAVQQHSVPPLETGDGEPIAAALHSEIGTAPAFMVQREVSKLSDPAKVTVQIDKSIDAADTNVPTIMEILKGQLEPGQEPAVRQAVTNMARLVSLSMRFNPGALKDGEGNMHVYTCNGGAIDMGHFFISAAVAYAAGFLLKFTQPGKIAAALGATPENVSLAAGYGMEVFQQGFRSAKQTEKGASLYERLPESWRAAIDGLVHSAYTVEDLPSDKYGAELGGRMWAATAMGQGGWEQALNVLSGLPPFDLKGDMRTFFSSKGAIYPADPKRRDLIVQELSGTGPYRRQSHTTEPVLAKEAEPFCQ